MQTNPDSWYADDRTSNWYFFDISTGDLTQDPIPQDYEEEAHNPHLCGRFRYCHALIERRNDLDRGKICDMFYRNLFEESVKFAPWEHGISEEFKDNRRSDILNYIDRTLRAERNVNVDKFLITVKFGVFVTNLDLNHDYYSAEGDIDEEIEFVPASKSSIDGLEIVLDSGFEFECAVCLEKGKKEAKRMPCGHAFHDRCIEKWLEKSCMCPVCRYILPCDS
ncbi:T24P13.18 [Hibiscus syriacus]|uniref:RING-type E3 ubiquitin transferase n=1 Tax=Hibiscus syriacus TaxID=106335 RepID=A0A6A3C2V9_HIBSY|nr:T24P13.18 [Hibiscus syriacus]